MKTETYQLPAEELMQTAKVIAENGGPVAPWHGPDAWCVLEYGDIEQRDKYANLIAECHCPPAVEAAVIAYAVNLRTWDYQQRVKASSRIPYNERHDFQPVIRAVPNSGKEAATLIIAVAEAMGGKHD